MLPDETGPLTAAADYPDEARNAVPISWFGSGCYEGQCPSTLAV